MEIFDYPFTLLDSRMYVTIEENSALIIDPNISKDALELLKQNNVNAVTVVLTHEHYDHISGVNWLRENFENIHVICSANARPLLQNCRKNFAAYADILLMGKNFGGNLSENGWDVTYTCDADQDVDGDRWLGWMGHSLFLKQTPGHSKGSICVLLDNHYIFTGDSLVTGADVITKFPGGSKKDYTQITLPFIKGLDPDIMVLPGHGDRMQLKAYCL